MNVFACEFNRQHKFRPVIEHLQQEINADLGAYILNKNIPDLQFALSLYALDTVITTRQAPSTAFAIASKVDPPI